MITEPLVSVLMTAYNSEKYISEAIESVLASTYQNWELIIVDDCSIDKTVEIAQNFAQKDKRIQVYINKKNLGDYPNRNKAASYAKGKFLKYLDSDDIIYPYTLNILVNAMEKYPEGSFAMSHTDNQQSNPFPFKISSQEAYEWHFLGRGLLNRGPSSVIVRKDLFNKVGGFLNKRHFCDTDMWYKLAAKYPIIIVQPGLVWLREHFNQEAQIENRNIDFVDIRYKNNINTLSKSDIPLSRMNINFALKKLKRNHARKLLSLFFKQKQYKNALYLLKKSELNIWQILCGFKRYL